MNSYILMAEIIRNPELRYTPDNQTPIAEMLVQFPGLRPEDPAATLKVVGWGNLAQEIQERYHEGDRVVIEGRLTMSTIDRPEGFKEKRAELTAQRIHSLGKEAPLVASPVSTTSSKPSPGYSSAPARSEPPAPSIKSEPTGVSTPRAVEAEPEFDDIPF
jgi:single-stranded DNA-binding protein